MLVFAIISGGWAVESLTWAPWFDYTGVQLTRSGGLICGCGTAGLAGPARLPSTFLKIGTIVGLAIGI